MDQVILKYELPLRHGCHRLAMHDGAVVLCVAFQGDTLCVWVRSSVTTGRGELRLFNCVFTGMSSQISDGDAYIGTAHSGHGIVVHVFEAAKPAPE